MKTYLTMMKESLTVRMKRIEIPLHFYLSCPLKQPDADLSHDSTWQTLSMVTVSQNRPNYEILCHFQNSSRHLTSHSHCLFSCLGFSDFLRPEIYIHTVINKYKNITNNIDPTFCIKFVDKEKKSHSLSYQTPCVISDTATKVQVRPSHILCHYIF